MLRALEKDEEAGDVARVWTAPAGSMGDSWSEPGEKGALPSRRCSLQN